MTSFDVICLPSGAGWRPDVTYGLRYSKLNPTPVASLATCPCVMPCASQRGPPMTMWKASSFLSNNDLRARLAFHISLPVGQTQCARKDALAWHSSRPSETVWPPTDFALACPMWLAMWRARWLNTTFGPTMFKGEGGGGALYFFMAQHMPSCYNAEKHNASVILFFSSVSNPQRFGRSAAPLTTAPRSPLRMLDCNTPP